MTSVYCACVLFLVGIVSTSATSQPGPGAHTWQGSLDTRGMCVTSEGAFRHGEVFTKHRTPCRKYRCEFGRVKVLETGCPDDGQCHRPGSEWASSDCHTYKCHPVPYHSARIERLRSGCRDAYGQCRQPGEVFPYAVRGHIYSGCSCTSTPKNIKYTCPPRWNPRWTG